MIHTCKKVWNVEGQNQTFDKAVKKGRDRAYKAGAWKYT